MHRFSKQPAERLTKALEWVNRLPPGVSVVSATLVAIRTDTSADVTSTVLTSSTGVISGTQVKLTVRDGTSSLCYKITILTTFSDGTILEEDWEMTVESI